MSVTFWYARTPATATAVGCTGKTGPVKSPFSRLRSTRLPDRVRLPAGADHRDRAREEQPLDGAGLRMVFPRRHHLLGGLGRREFEGEPDDAVLEPLLGLVSRLPEHLAHPAVLRQDVGDEPPDAAFAGRGGDVLEQHGADAAALLGVLDEEGHLRIAVTDLVVADDRHHLRADGGNEGDTVDIVDVDEVLDLPVREARPGREETVVNRFRGQSGIEHPKEFAVIGSYRAQMGRSAIGEDDVGLPVLNSLVRVPHEPTVAAGKYASRSRPTRVLLAVRFCTG